MGTQEVLPSKTVRNIGAMLDSSLSMESHVNAVVKACYFQIRSLSKIRKYLTDDSAKSLVHAYVTSRLDNMNSLLYDATDSKIHKLKLVQNNAARLIMKKKEVLSHHPTFEPIALAACRIQN